MVKIISFEGCIGAGKTSLTEYFSDRLEIEKLLEDYEGNPFLREFYEGSDVKLETEITFLLMHYSQLKKAIKDCNTPFILADFSIEKDLVFAVLNLNEEQLRVFRRVYNYVIQQVGTPYAVLYLDLPREKLERRILQRKRPYEMVTDVEYFWKFNSKVKEYFKKETRSKASFFNVDNLQFDPDNETLRDLSDKILELMKCEF